MVSLTFKQIYSAPEIEEIKINPEAGFAASDSGSSESFGNEEGIW